LADFKVFSAQRIFFRRLDLNIRDNIDARLPTPKDSPKFTRRIFTSPKKYTLARTAAEVSVHQLKLWQTDDAITSDAAAWRRRTDRQSLWFSAILAKQKVEPQNNP
jgi:hypothetical protein